MKKNLLKHTLVIAALSALSITACANKTAKESSTVSPTETAKESSSVNSGEAEKESLNADSEETEKENSNPKSTESESAKEGEKEQAENKSNSPLVGAYNTNLVSFSLKDNPDAMNAFEAAFPNGYNYTHYEPIALLGTQVVSGTNYLYLCKSTWTDYQENVSFVLLQIYQDLSGKSEVMGSAILFPTEESREEGEDYIDNTGSYLPENIPAIQNAFNEAVKDNENVSYIPLAYIGKHSQEGKPEEDVIFTAKKSKGKDAKANYELLYIGKDKDGKAKLVKSEDVEFPDF
ncbi:hypothetical protein HMPREF9624_00530 [Oribacterium asaccharolyticum ACB7]|uniref:Lipoprotein n=1 Tax=Oribacterium asaccharolyticum ACB7 TaxID=796944 RepID=G9WU20_9FIRM|nr:hypothetical protein [Oribacterium asaccharolyticum]EHL12223.1 hypothetical protein HMPREF9624_00530 [Oribacterium asaccharolyticum ACB7]